MHISGNIELAINRENHATLFGMEKVKMQPERARAALSRRKAKRNENRSVSGESTALNLWTRKITLQVCSKAGGGAEKKIWRPRESSQQALEL